MKTSTLSLALTAMMLLPVAAAAADKQYVFPAKGQSEETQKKDEADCDSWAVKETGFNPAKPPAPPAKPTQQQNPQQAAQQQNAATGKGAVSGAAMGYIIGDLANDEGGEGAAIGAAVGAMRGRNKAKQQQAAAVQQTDAQYKAALDKYNADLAAKQTEFNKARGACLEAKGYTVK